MNNFYNELTELINKYSLEDESNTPDYVLVGYIRRSLEAFNNATCEREAWYGRHTNGLQISEDGNINCDPAVVPRS